MFIKNLIIFSLSLITTNGLYYNDTLHLESIKSDLILFTYYHPWFNQTIEFLQIFSNSQNINSKCRSSIKRWTNGIEDKESWAIKLLESTGKTINGKLVGRNVNFGSFDYCTLFNAGPIKIDFNGKYCLVSLQTHESKLIKSLPNFQKYYNLLSEESKRLTIYNLGNAYGACIPSTCDINELVNVFNEKFKSQGFSMLAPNRCTTKNDSEPWTKLQIFSFFTLSIFILFCGLSFYFKNDFMRSFSLVDNFNKIYNVNLEENSNEKAYLHGLKVIFLSGTIAVHSYLFAGLYFVQPFAPVKEVFRENSDDQGAFYFIRILMERLILICDQLFFLGGFFAMYSWYDVIKYKRTEFNFRNYISTKYFRILIIAIPILLMYFILPQLGSGPYYSDITNHLTINCKRTYHKIFLQTSNTKEETIDLCNIGSWFNSADFWIYLVNYFLIYYLVTNPKIGLKIAFAQIILNNLIGFIYRRWFDLPFIHNHFNVDFYEISVTQDLYFPFMFHLDSYLMGILCAYLVKTNIKFKILDYKLIRMIIWIVIMSSVYLIVFWYPHHLEITNRKPKKYLEMFYPSLNGLLMSSLSFWLLYSLSLGYNKILAQFLSIKFWIPISRLSFVMSLCQFIYITYSFATTRNSYSLNFENFIKEAVHNFIFTFLLANFIFLFYGAPMTSLFKKYSNYYKNRSELIENNLKND